MKINIKGRGSQRTRKSLPRAWTHPAEAWKSSRSTGLFILKMMVMNNEMVMMVMVVMMMMMMVMVVMNNGMVQ